MGFLLMAVGVVLYLVGAVGAIMILIHAFQTESLFSYLGLSFVTCGLYAIYYSFFHFEHEQKVLVLVALFGGSASGEILYEMGARMAQLP